MNCYDLEKEIVSYYCGELSGEERQEFEKHLQLCPDCARFSWEMSQAIKASREIYPQKEPVDLWTKVQTRIMEEPPRLLSRWVLSPAISLLLIGTIITATFIRMQPPASATDMEIVKEYEFVTDFELLENMDVLENDAC
jgi:anti-sigma factor RsiW